MAITAGANLNSAPLPQKQAATSNYIDFTASGTSGWAQQYLPDLMSQEAEVFGNRTISGFLAQVGAEEPMQSDQVIWSEQGRLHLSYNLTFTGGSNAVTIGTDIDGQAAGASHGIRVNDTVLITSATVTYKAIVTTVASAVVTCKSYDQSVTLPTDSSAGVILVYGSEYGKGQSYNNDAGSAAADSRTSNEPQFQQYNNKPIILKDYYEINGSDTSQVGWVEVTTEEGAGGYLWYVKAASETKMRFADYLEMAMLESVKDSNLGSGTLDDFVNGAGEGFGTQGLFDAIEKRGNTTSGVTGVNAATDLAEFDAILAEFDKQGAIEENMLFVDRGTSLAIDDMLASMNSYGAGGTSYGVFDNSSDMALNLGFSGFRRGSYDFYKSDFRYLNDKGTRGGLIDTVNAVRGVVIPAGVTSVYDQMLGRNLKRPFLHVRFRASETDNRYMKSWITGSVGAATSALDAMQMHMLSERCLVTQGANNFMIMK
tara:strand:+ start:556 stop:2007 length:1452 start_codon:yes stop_codon:yes gene_type:complete